VRIGSDRLDKALISGTTSAGSPAERSARALSLRTPSDASRTACTSSGFDSSPG
jgi:hypothetical protein